MWRLHGRTEECARPVFGMLQFPSVPLFTRCHVLRTLEPVRNMELHPRGDIVATQNEDTDLLRPTGIYPTDLSRKTGAEIGRAHVCTPVNNAHLVCRLLLEKKQQSKN